MPYQDVIGHRRLVHLLARSVTRQSLPPSLIFAGPRGVGKRLVAVATAQVLNCTSVRTTPPGSGSGVAARHGPGLSERGEAGFQPDAEAPEVDACGVCPACARIARGIHPDVLIVEPGDSGSIKIEQVRDIVDRAGYRPFEGRRRAVIIDEADAVVPQAQNALLKTLEEPPSSSVFMLVTSRPDMLLTTVRSRCPRLQFRPLGPDEVAAALVRQGRAPAEAHAIAATAGGSVGQALAASAREIIQSRDVAVRVLSQAASRDDAGRRIEGAKDLAAADRAGLAAHLRAMASLVRDVELLSNGADARSLANPDVQSEIEGLSAYRGERGVQAFAAIDRGLAALERNAGVKLVADWVVLQL